MVTILLYGSSSNFSFAKWNLYKILECTSCDCDGVTQVSVRKLQKLEDD
jgi:hypothetical protein